MSNTLTIIAKVEAKKESLTQVKAELLKLIAPTLKEDGCIQYDLHQDNENPSVFMFFENWESQDLWEAHMQSSHLKAFVESTDGLLVDLTVYQMSKVSLTL